MANSPTDIDQQYAKRLFILTVLWLVLVLGAGGVMVYFL